MSEDTKETDVAPIENEEQTEELSTDDELNEKPSEVEDKLDIDDLLAKPKSKLKSKDERLGLSRKEILELKANQENASDERFEALQEKIDNLEATLSNLDLDGISRSSEEIKKTRAEIEIHNMLSNEGISPTEFNKKYKESFKKERDELIAGGMSHDLAIKKALQYSFSQRNLDNKDSENRAEGRNSAKLPPKSTLDIDTLKSVKQEKLATLSQPEYNKVMEQVKAGKIRIV